MRQPVLNPGRLWKAGFYVLLALVLALATALVLLRWEAGRSREAWFDSRQGQLESAEIEPPEVTGSVHSTSVRLVSDSGLQVSFRVVRAAGGGRLPVLLVLGGHRTGSSAVEFFGAVEHRAIVALDYPYDGPQKLHGVADWFAAIPLIRQAFLDMPPAISLVVDWLHEQPWADPEEIIMVGVSLGVPFAATAAARDRRLKGLVVIHGAADNRRWLELNIGRRMDLGPAEPAMATLAHWLAYGPVFDTARRIAAVSPRPVVIVGARNDERLPDGQTELLFEAAREPKTLRWTDGAHVDPAREDVIEELLQIAGEELPLPGPRDRLHHDSSDGQD
jgi:hypothetical protein